MGEPVHFELTGDEGLVLFEFLARFDNNGMLTIQDKAEERALWKLRGLLESSLSKHSSLTTRTCFVRLMNGWVIPWNKLHPQSNLFAHASGSEKTIR